MLSREPAEERNLLGGTSAPTLAPIPAGDRSNTAAFQAALGAVFCPTGTAGGKTSNGGTQVACNGSNINPVALNLLQLKNPDGTLLLAQLRDRDIHDCYVQYSGEI